MKRRNVLSGPSTSSAGSSTAQTPSAHLVYLDVCILCNEGINSVMLGKYPALNEAIESSVEVRAEDTDVLVMLVHHRANHPVFLTTAKDTSYDVGKIREALPESKLCKTDQSERAMDVFSDIRAKKSDIYGYL
ncbi:unnamed protein product [Arctogadus glacialis]